MMRIAGAGARIHKGRHTKMGAFVTKLLRHVVAAYHRCDE